MSKRRAVCRRRDHCPRAGANALEPLEPRLLLSGNVTAEVVSGDLVLTGDGFNNDIEIDQAGLGSGEFRVGSGPNATLINMGVGDVVLTGSSTAGTATATSGWIPASSAGT